MNSRLASLLLPASSQPSGAQAPGTPPWLLALLAATAGFAGSAAMHGSVRLVAGTLMVPPIAIDGAQVVIGLAAEFVLLAPLAAMAVSALLLEAFAHWRVDPRMASFLCAAAWAAWHGWVNDMAQVLPMFWMFWLLCTLYERLRRTLAPQVAGIYAAAAHAVMNLAGLVFIAAAASR